MTEEILTAIREADLVLVGIGEEFDETGVDGNAVDYIKGREFLEKEKKLWLIPDYDKRYREQNSGKHAENMLKALGNLAELLKDKNYFVVSTAMNDMIAATPWKEGRLVMPCGDSGKKQCSDGCEEGLQELLDADQCNIAAYIDSVRQDISDGNNAKEATTWQMDIGICPKCGKPLILNNIYAEKYDEKGYLSQWQLYTKWLQGTLNKKLVIIELGVGMKFPSVIRWPFEKVAFFNNKAHMYRVNGRLYQLSEELKGKGTAIAKNSIDWLLSLC